jgi:cytochrome P450
MDLATTKITGAIVCFLHALFIHPEVAQRVFEEIHSITQSQRLPKITDRARLPYAEAVFKESVRMYPFMPLGWLFLMNSLSLVLLMLMAAFT